MNRRQLASQVAKALVTFVVTAILSLIWAAVRRHKAELLTSASGIWDALTGPLIPPWLFAATCVLAFFGLLRVYRDRNKPTLHVVWDPQSASWHLGAVGGTPAMQVCAWALFSHTQPGVNLVLSQAYFRGTTCAAAFPDPIVVNFGVTVKTQVICFVKPVRAKQGEPFRGGLIFVDQLNRKHKTPEVEFAYA